MGKKYDVVIAGAGHHGLTVACYLAKAGLNVCLVERNAKVGGGVPVDGMGCTRVRHGRLLRDPCPDPGQSDHPER